MRGSPFLGCGGLSGCFATCTNSRLREFPRKTTNTTQVTYADIHLRSTALNQANRQCHLLIESPPSMGAGGPLSLILQQHSLRQVTCQRRRRPDTTNRPEHSRRLLVWSQEIATYIQKTRWSSHRALRLALRSKGCSSADDYTSNRHERSGQQLVELIDHYSAQLQALHSTI